MSKNYSKVSFFIPTPGAARFFCPLFLIPYLLGVLFVFLCQNMINGVDFHLFELIIPSIKGYGIKSKFEQLSIAYFSLTSIIFIPWLYLSIKYEWFFFGTPERLNEFKQRALNSKFPKLYCIFSILFFTAIIYFSWIQPGYQYGLMPINEKKWALALYGPFFSFFTFLYFFIGAILQYSKILLQISTRRE
jgi:hypothetical protein